MSEAIESPEMLLISNITHQAINPLNGVIGTIDNIIKATVPEEKRQQRLISARSQLEYTVTLLRNLAYFAQYSGADVVGYKKESARKKVRHSSSYHRSDAVFPREGKQLQYLYRA